MFSSETIFGIDEVCGLANQHVWIVHCQRNESRIYKSSIMRPDWLLFLVLRWFDKSVTRHAPKNTLRRKTRSIHFSVKRRNKIQSILKNKYLLDKLDVRVVLSFWNDIKIAVYHPQWGQSNSVCEEGSKFRDKKYIWNKKKNRTMRLIKQ